MALVGKYTKYEIVETGETEIQTVEYPSNLPEDHPDFDKAGTTEEVEVPIQQINSTVYDNAYVTVQAMQTWKHYNEMQGNKTLFNITYNVYESEESRINDINSYIHQDYIDAQYVDYDSEELEIQQAYKIIKTAQGCEELIND